jgi:hypothetical protein
MVKSKSITPEVRIARRVYKRIRPMLQKKLIDGYATCTYAAYHLGMELEKNNIKATVIDGEYKGWGHWWIVANHKILDIGNNIDAIETGKINIKIRNHPNKSYVPEHTMTFKEFKKHFRQIKRF